MQRLLFDTATAVEFSDAKMTKVNLYESHRLFCDVYCLLPGQSQRPHVHNDEDKIYFALTGTCEVQIGESAMALPPGHVAIAPAGVLHGIVNRSDLPATVLTIMAPHPRIKPAV